MQAKSWPSRAIGVMDREDFVSRGQALSVPCSLVNSVGQFAQDRQPRSRGFFVRQPLAALGEFDVPGGPFRSRQPLLAQYRRPAPRLGEHEPATITREWQSSRPAVPPPGSPLAGIKVISFGMVIAGAVCATMLAELGADVIKIESPMMPDSVRRVRMGDPAVREPSGAPISPIFASTTARSAASPWTWSTSESVDLVLRLASVAHVVIENFGPDVLERWGVGNEKIAAVNPQIVMLSQSGFGRTGPRSHYLAYASTVFSFVGLTQIWGQSHPRPTITQPLRTACSRFWPPWRLVTAPGKAPTSTRLRSRWPERSWPRCCSITWSTGTNRVGIRRPAWWSAASATTSGWPSSPNTTPTGSGGQLTGAPDPADHAAVAAAVAAWAAELRPQQATRMLQRAGLAAGSVQSIEDVTRDSQHRERHYLQEMNHPDLGVAEHAGAPHRLSKTPATIKRRTPRLGEHTTEILTEWLGMPPEES